MYRLKEKGLARIFVDLMGIKDDSTDAKMLLNW